MLPERLTIKAREALQAAQTLASEAGHPEVCPLHLLCSLSGQSGGIVAPVLERLGVDPRAVTAAVADRLGSASKVEGQSEVAVSRAMSTILKDADRVARKFQDDYLSTEHMLLAIARSRDEAAELLTGLGATEQGILVALREVRGSSRVTDDKPEDRFQALERYARDLTGDVSAKHKRQFS